MTPYLSANPRFYDRLLAVCSALLGAALLFLAVQALQPPLGPSGEGTSVPVQVRGITAESGEAASPEVASSQGVREEPAS